jgi:hypothetical protein
MKSWRADLLGLIVIVSFAAVCVLMFRGGAIDVSVKDVALVLVGQLGAKFGTVVDYHFGSSAGSAAKDQTLSEKGKTP